MGEKPWVAPTGVILPSLRGSYVNIIFTVGYVRVAHFTHGWGLPPLRGFVAPLSGAD